MANMQRYFLDVMKAFVNRTGPPVSDHVDWCGLFWLAKIHSVSGILSFMTQKLDGAHQPEPEVMRLLREQYFSTVAISTQKEVGMLALIDRMIAENIPHLLIKGYVLKDYYPIKELRTFGDIDFYIHHEDRRKCHDLMLSLGYKCTYSEGEVWTYALGKEVYEIHTGLVSKLSPNKEGESYFRGAWDYAVPGENSLTFTFTPEYHLLYIMQHIAKHINYNGAGIRMFMDVAVFVRHFNGRLNWDLLFGELKKVKLYVFAQQLFTLCKVWFDTEFPFALSVLDQEFQEKMLEYVLSAGTFGYSGRKITVYAVRKNIPITGVSKFVTFRAALSYLFPPYSAMKSMYRFIKGRPYLLLVGWIVRAFKVFTQQRKKAVSWVKDLQDSTEDAFKQYDLLRQLGVYESLE